MNTFYNVFRHRSLFARCIVPISLLLGACGSDTKGLDEPKGSSEPTSDDGNGDAPNNGDPTGADPSSGDDPGTPPPPCDEATTAAIQASIDKAIPDDIDGVAFVKDPSCGERYFTHGPSKYPVTTGHFIASNTKTYVASLILLLIDEGLLKLDDPISKWIDNVPGGDAITVRQTLNHSSGLFDFGQDVLFGIKVKAGGTFTPLECIAIGFRNSVYFAPGQGFGYSNTNYFILGVIAELVTNKPLQQLLRERIFEPMGAKSTYLRGTQDPPMELAVGKNPSGGTEYSWGPTATWAAGGIAATVDELARWAERRGSKAFHSPAANAALFDTIPTDPKDETSRYGAGIYEYAASWTHGGGAGFGHMGTLPGFTSWSLYFPDKKTTIAVIADSSGNVGPKYYGEVLLFAVLDPLFGYVTSDAGASTP